MKTLAVRQRISNAVGSLISEEFKKIGKIRLVIKLNVIAGRMVVDGSVLIMKH